MAADGAYRWHGMASAPDPARVAEIDATLGDDVSAFAETARAAAVERIERALAAVGAGDLTEAAAQLTHARSVLDGLHPGALEPRRGLAGLFDGRGGRLKRFRAAFDRAAAGLTEAARELGERIDSAGRRSDVLDGLWTGIRDAVVDLDAHLAVAAQRLAGHPPVEGAPRPPLHDRKAALDACRAAAVQALPLIRGAQNADARSAEALKTCTEGLAAWRDDWKAALGLSGRRPKRVRPDQGRLSRLRDDVLARIDAAMAELNASRARRAEVEGRLAELRKPL